MVSALVHGHATATRTRFANNQPVNPQLFLLQNQPNRRHHRQPPCLQSRFVPHDDLRRHHRQQQRFLRCHRRWEIPCILRLNQHSRELSLLLPIVLFNLSLFFIYLRSFCAHYHHRESYLQADRRSYHCSNLSTFRQTHVSHFSHFLLHIFSSYSLP